MKRNYWPLFFIAIFSFAFGMIVWTIHSAIKVPVNQDETFLSSYHDVDRDYNKIVNSNKAFEKKYKLELTINKKTFDLEYKDMFLAQRAIEEKSKHKDIFNNGQNIIKVAILDKKTDTFIKDFDIKIRVSRPTSHEHTVDLLNKDFSKNENGYDVSIVLPFKGNWNITGKIALGSDIGYFYIKSNAI